MALSRDAITVKHSITTMTADAPSNNASLQTTVDSFPPRPASSRLMRFRSASSVPPNTVKPLDASDTTKKATGGRWHSPRQGSTSASLVDFLRNKTPPPENYMSYTDDQWSLASSQPASNWSSPWGLFRRLSSRSGHSHHAATSPKNYTSHAGAENATIKLPDSAVAGTTTGGHRHIAISIPLQYMPFANCSSPTAAPAASPVSQSAYNHGPPNCTSTSTTGSASVPVPALDLTPTEDGDVSMPASNGSIRTFVGDKGTVTVLRTVEEHQESTGALVVPLDMVPRRRVPLDPGTSISSASPLTSHTTGEWFSHPRSNHQLPPRKSLPYGNSSDLQDKTSRRPLLPVMMPSSASGVDGTSSAKVAEPVTLNKAFSTPQVFGNHTQSASTSAIAESVTTMNSEPVIDSAQTTKLVGGNPAHVFGSPDLPDGPFDADGNRSVTVITESPLVNTNRPAKAHRRRDLAQDRRDREVQPPQPPRGRAKKIPRNRKLMPPTHSLDLQDSFAVDPIPAPQVPTENLVRTPLKPAFSSGAGHSSLTPIMVVADVKPNGINRHTRHTRQSTAASSELADSMQPHAAMPSSLQTASCASIGGPKLPGSPVGTISLAGSRQALSYDRASLSRRREWSAVSQDRNRFVLTPRGDRSKHSQSGWDSSAPTPVAKESTTARTLPLRHDLTRTVQSLNELRIRSTERRLRRLERNGEVWMRTLVPVLDELSHTLTALHEDKVVSPGPRRGRVAGRRNWVDDDDADASLASPTRPVVPPSRGSARGPQTDHDRLVTELSRLRHSLDSWLAASGSQSSVISGLDVIEPLMRELQGAAAGNGLGAFGHSEEQSGDEDGEEEENDDDDDDDEGDVSGAY